MSPRQQRGRGRAASRPNTDTVVMPAPTKATALEFAKLLSAGVGPEQALLYIPGAAVYAEHLNTLKGKLRSAAFNDWLSVWMSSRLVADAVDESRGGKWQDIPRERQAELALDKHIAEVALYLLQHQYDGMAADRAADARKTLTAYLADKRGQGEASVLLSFVRDVMEGKATVSRSVYKETASVEIGPQRPQPPMGGGAGGNGTVLDIAVERKRLQ